MKKGWKNDPQWVALHRQGMKDKVEYERLKIKTALHLMGLNAKIDLYDQMKKPPGLREEALG